MFPFPETIGYVELALGIILAALAYEKPGLFTDVANSILGKVMMIIAIIFILKIRGLASGLLAALIMVILMHKSKEGLETRRYSGCIPKTPKDNKNVKCYTDQECGSCKTVCVGGDAKTKTKGQCRTVIYPEKSVDVKDDKISPTARKSASDVRITEGLMNRNSRLATIGASKFRNGFTGNREAFGGFI